MSRVHSNQKECRIIAGRERRLWYMKYGYLQTQHVNRCTWGKLDRETKNYFWVQYRRPHPSYRERFATDGVGYSRRQGNRNVWSCSWIRPRKSERWW